MTISTEETVHSDAINSAHGHTIDGEGLLNNYAIEPEMYIEYGAALSKLTQVATYGIKKKKLLQRTKAE
jgi:hypothetical protein